MLFNLTYNDRDIIDFFYELKDNYNLFCEINVIVFNLVFFDFILIKLFSDKARWFQLHAVVNLYISYEILPEVINIIKDPITGYQICGTNRICLLIICLHVYHVLTFKKLNRVDYFHHVVFVGLGVLPDMFFIKYNQKYLAYIVASGIPGFFEYSTLTLYKNNLLTLKQQKHFNSILYNFVRLPFCCFAIAMNYNAYLNNYVKDDLLITLYVNILLYLNGTIFNFLTIISYIKVRENEKLENKFD